MTQRYAHRDLIEPTQEEIDAVAAVFRDVENDPTAAGSAYIMAKKLKRVFVASEQNPK